MNYSDWQLKRKQLMEIEKDERSKDWQNARGHIQAAVNEQAIRELYDLTATIQERIEAIEAKRGPGRPPNPKAE